MVSVSRAVVASSGFRVYVAESGELIPKCSEAAERLPSLLYHFTPKGGGAETGREDSRAKFADRRRYQEPNQGLGLKLCLLTIVVITSIMRVAARGPP